MKAEYRTDKGKIRPTNQDTVLFEQQNGLYGIADGMGGHLGGDIASQAAAKVICEKLRNIEPGASALKLAAEDANAQIRQLQAENPECGDMGTTLTLLWCNEATVLLGHIGDSKAFLFHHNKLRQMSRDHSLVGEMIRKGAMTREQAKKSPYRNIITRALGADKDIDIDISMFDCYKGDRWLVCSDGLTEHVADDEIEMIIRTNGLKEAADLLIQTALENGGSDNVSLVLLEVAG